MLIYTFRTLRFIDSLGENVFVFGKLREDFDQFREQVRAIRPIVILGIGSARQTQYEALAVNQYHGKVLDMSGPSSFSLFIPPSELPVSYNGTTSFCNWTTYKIAQFLEREDLQTKLVFLHIAPHDEKVLAQELKQLGL